MTEKKKNPKSWIVTLLLAGGALAYVFLVFLPGQRSISTLREELTTKQGFIIETDSIAASIVEAEEKLKDVESYIEKWRDEAPAEAELANWFGRVHEQVEASGITTRRFEPQKVTRMDAVWMLPLAVGTNGKFAEVSQLLARLENLPGTVWLDEVIITLEGKDTENLQAEVTLALFADNQEDSD
jgi:Tfp pilus assembly protein PilO